MLLNEMLLLEDSGNLRKLSPTVLKCFIKYDHDGNIGSNSVIRILPYNKSTIKKIIEDRELLSGFVLRYGQEDLISIIFSSRIGEGYFYYRLIKTNFAIFNRLKIDSQISYSRNFDILRDIVMSKYNISKEEAEQRLNVQLVYKDLERNSVKNIRKSNYNTDDFIKVRGKALYNGENHHGKIHGSFADVDNEVYEERLKQRLADYINKKYSNIEDERELENFINKNGATNYFKFLGSTFTCINGSWEREQFRPVNYGDNNKNFFMVYKKTDVPENGWSRDTDMDKLAYIVFLMKFNKNTMYVSKVIFMNPFKGTINLNTGNDKLKNQDDDNDW